VPIDLIIVLTLVTVQLSLSLWSALIGEVVNPPLQLVACGVIFAIMIFYLTKYGMQIIDGVMSI